MEDSERSVEEETRLGDDVKVMTRSGLWRSTFTSLSVCTAQ